MDRLLRFRIMLVVIAVGVLFLFLNMPPQRPGSDTTFPDRKDALLRRSPNAFRIGAKAVPFQMIRLNEPRELDGSTRQAVLRMRKKEVERFGRLVEGDYVPYAEPFWQIVDRKPWWGIEGQFCQGPGPQSIEGPSEETRFLFNPFLLLGIDEIKSFTVQELPCEPAYPHPVGLRWYAREARAEAVYDIRAFFDLRRLLPEEYGDYHVLSLATTNYNARDFGYQYVSADPSSSVNVDPVEGARLFTAAIPLQGLIHLGGSCRYPGGCNNASPHEPDLEFRIRELPAKLHCKLWKNKPASPADRADFTYILVLQ